MRRGERIKSKLAGARSSSEAFFTSSFVAQQYRWHGLMLDAFRSFFRSFVRSFLTALDSILYSERDGALGEGAAMREQLTTLSQQLADHAAKELQAEEENQREVSQSVRPSVSQSVSQTVSPSVRSLMLEHCLSSCTLLPHHRPRVHNTLALRISFLKLTISWS